MPALPALAAALLTALLLLSQPARAATGIPIERAQRELQARYNFTQNGLLAWPCSRCKAAPAFPRNGFYGDLDKDPLLARDLVRNLAQQFYVNAVYNPFLNTTNGVYGIEGAAQNEPYWLCYAYGGGDPSSGPADFPYGPVGVVSLTYSGVDGWSADLSGIETNTYGACFTNLLAYIEKLNWISVDFTCKDLAAWTGASGDQLGCDAAKNAALNLWGTGDWQAGGPVGTTVSLNHSTQQGVDHYTASGSTSRGRFTTTDGWMSGYWGSSGRTNGTGTVNFFLLLDTLGGDLAGNTPPVVADGTYRRYTNLCVNLATNFDSGLIGGKAPAYDFSCDQPSGTTTTYGWGLRWSSGPGPIPYCFACLKPDFNTDADEIDPREGGCAACQGGNVPGAVTLTEGSPGLTISLGLDSQGQSAGYLYLRSRLPVNGPIAPLTLIYCHSLLVPYGNWVDNMNYNRPIYDDASFYTGNSDCTVQVSQDGYAITFSEHNNSAHIYSSVSILRQNGDNNQLVVTEQLGPPGTTSKEITLTFSPSSGPSGSGTWTTSGGDSGGPLSLTAASTSWSTPTNRQDTTAVQDVNNNTASTVTEYSQVFPWGRELTQRTVGSGASAQTTTWTYYTDPANDGGNYSQLKQVTGPDGRWERFLYDSTGRLTNAVAQFANNAPTGAASLPGANRETRISFADNTSLTVELLQGTTISRTYEVHDAFYNVDYGYERVQTIRCATTNASVAAPGNLTNVVWRATDTTLTGHYGDTLAELNPDGTMTLYAYGSSRTATTGLPDPSTWTWPDLVAVVPPYWPTITEGTTTTTQLGSWGEILSRTSTDVASTLTLDSDTYTYTDDLRRSYYVTHLDNSIEGVHYNCCGMDFSTNRDGLVTQYFYDAARRQTASKTLGITTTNLLDAAGRAIRTTRLGTDDSPMVLSSTVYDDSGIVRFETNALGGCTRYGELWGGGHWRGITNDDGGTRLEQYNQDGSLQSVSGTAVAPARYEYGADASGSFTKEIKLGTYSDSGEWTKSYTDILGRPCKTIYAGSASPTATTAYNRLGQMTNQVDPDGVITLYAYNIKGELAYTILHSNRNTYQPDWGLDRITYTTNDVTTDHGTTVRRTRTYVYPIPNDSTAVLLSQTEQSVDGLHTWTTTWGNGRTLTSSTATGYAGLPVRSVVQTAPDGSSTVSLYLNGILQYVARHAYLGAQLSLVNYYYDAHGRQYRLADARNGNTDYTFNAADQVATITTPAPAPGQSPQVTTYLYDKMGRVRWTLLPDATWQTNNYNLAGLVTNTCGSRTYPVDYTFDSQNRIQTMTTWKDYAGRTGPATTTWNYDASRGWLTSKYYPDHAYPTYYSGLSYSYFASGRLWYRTDTSRNVTTGYAYSGAGDLASVTYYGNAPTANLTYGYDRLGRQVTVTQGSGGSAITTTRTFDDLGNLVVESYSGGPLNALSVTNAYDSFFRRTNLVARQSNNPLIQQSFTYDFASRLVTAADVSTASRRYSATYTYVDNSPLVRQIEFASNGIVKMTTTKTYDFLNRLTQISSAPSASSAVNFSYQYNAANQRTNRTDSDNSHWSYGYDSLGQVTSGKKYFPDSTPMAGQQFEYAFDDIGNRKSTSFGGDASGANLVTANYSANNVNQYTSRTVPKVIEVSGTTSDDASVASIASDGSHAAGVLQGTNFHTEVPVHNNAGPQWLSLTNYALRTNAPGSIYTTDSRQVFVPATPEQFTYDPAGNLTSDGRWTYGWDAENRLTNMTALSSLPTGAKLKLDFAYDWQGRRIQKIVSTNNGSAYGPLYTNKFVYDGWNLIAVLGPQSSVLQSFLWGLDLSGSMQGAGGVGGLLMVSQISNSQILNYFTTYDGNGNVAALVNAADGTLSAQYEYGPFGEVLKESGPMARANPIRCSTKYRDNETGKLYFGARYYDSSTGGWLSQDPAGEEEGRNLYGFVLNDPVSLVDLLGFTWKLEKRDPGKPRTGASCDCDDKVEDLAALIKLEPKEYKSWLKPEDKGTLPASETEKITGQRKFSVPNEAHITQGDLMWRGGDLLSTVGKKKDMLMDAYKKLGYKVSDHFTGQGEGQEIDEFAGILGSADIYAWAHYGHGSGGNIKIAINASQGSARSYSASQFTPHHRLAEVVMYSCEAGKGGWASLVAKGGTLYATKDVIFQGIVELNIFKGDDPYYPLKKN